MQKQPNIQGEDIMNEKENFVDDLMNKAFNLEAPEMPDFAQIKEDSEVTELDFEQLDYLNAAGAMEITITRAQFEKSK